MLYYQNGVYGNAYDLLKEHCTGFLDADAVMQEINDQIGYLNGVYKNKSLNYDMYLIIKDGMITMEHDPAKFSSPLLYSDSLCSYTFTTGEKTMAMGSSYLPTSAPTISYIMTTDKNNGSSFVFVALEGHDTYMNGLYEKTSYTAPEKK